MLPKEHLSMSLRPGPGSRGSLSQRHRVMGAESKLDMQSEGTGNSEDLTGNSAAANKPRDVVCLLQPSL